MSKNAADEFSLERVIQVDTEFKCEIGKYSGIHLLFDSNLISFIFSDTNSANVVTTDVFLKVTRRKICLLFEMLPSFKANKLVDEITRASEGN